MNGILCFFIKLPTLAFFSFLESRMIFLKTINSKEIDISFQNPFFLSFFFLLFFFIFLYNAFFLNGILLRYFYKLTR